MKIPSDSEFTDFQRITNFGKFLRSYSLDEIPEFFNVLRGDMSIVGPRPLLEEYLELYSQEQRKRHDVLPGITGWAQINGRNDISWEEKLELDIWYVENKTTFLDLKIILTLWKVLTKKDTSPDNQATMDKFKGSKINLSSKIFDENHNILFTSSGRRVSLIKKFKKQFKS